MPLLAQLLIGFVIVIHLYIVWLEMFAWTTRGPKTFRSLRADLFEPTKVLAANQGLYNGFLAAGLIWALLIADPAWARNVASFFLGCVAVAGLYGAATAGRRILFVQTVPRCWPWPPRGWPDGQSAAYVCGVTALLPYFRSPAAQISYAPAAYVRLDWQATSASAADLQAVYEQVLRAMLRYGLTSLMSVHHQRPPMPPEVQTWLTEDWIPRAVATVSYGRCAIVQSELPLSRLAARAVGTGQQTALRYQYFDNEAAADSWLREA